MQVGYSHVTSDQGVGKPGKIDAEFLVYDNVEAGEYKIKDCGKVVTTTKNVTAEVEAHSVRVRSGNENLYLNYFRETTIETKPGLVSLNLRGYRGGEEIFAAGIPRWSEYDE